MTKVENLKLGPFLFFQMIFRAGSQHLYHSGINSLIFFYIMQDFPLKEGLFCFLFFSRNLRVSVLLICKPKLIQ